MSQLGAVCRSAVVEQQGSVSVTVAHGSTKGHEEGWAATWDHADAQRPQGAGPTLS